MVFKNKVRINGIVLLLLCFRAVFAQEPKQASDNAAIAYLNASSINSALYYGSIYEGYQRAKNHPYLMDILFTPARLSYQQVIYPEVLLKWDLLRDELIVQSPDFRSIVLFPEKVTFAELHGRQVIYFRSDSLPGCPPTGYYFLLHAGDCKVMGKTSAKMIEKINPGRIERHFEFKTRYYLYKDGEYHLIRNKKSVLNTMQPFAKEIRGFIASNHLNFRKDKELFLIQTVSEYEKLTHAK